MQQENEHNNSKIHGRHLNADFCKEIGLKIYMMEDDSELQDKKLMVFLITPFPFVSTLHFS